MADALSQDAVGALVRRELGTLAGGTERVEPGSVSFTNATEPRFVTVELTLVPTAPVGGWQVRVTRFAGFHELRVQVDRKHLRLMAPPGLVERLEAVLAARQPALERVRGVVHCERPLSVEATRMFPSGRRDFWTFRVLCRPGDAEVRIDVEDDGAATLKR